jgi:hypothetical protein
MGPHFHAPFMLDLSTAMSGESPRNIQSPPISTGSGNLLAAERHSLENPR